jgi:hypothetical protein
VKLLTGNSASRPAKLELRARGQVFTGEKRYPKGSPSPDPATRMTTEEVVAKFRHNATGVLTEAATDRVVDAVLNLESVTDVATLLPLTAASAAPPKPVASDATAVAR